MLLGGGDLSDQPVAEGIPVEGLGRSVRPPCRKCDPPTAPEHQFAVLARHREVVAEVFDRGSVMGSSCLAGPHRAGCATVATPIIASRVTSAASSSSLKSSVPAGRCGNTM